MSVPGQYAGVPTSLPLSLLMLGIDADHHDLTFSLDDLALLTHRLYRCAHLHFEHSFLNPGGL